MTTTCLLTTGHKPFDRRIFHKEARSLAESGYDVKLLAHADEDTTRDGVDIVSLGNADSRFDRIRHLPRAYRMARDIDAAVYHFHDPELLTVGTALAARTDAKVIFDAHEDYGNKGLYRRPWIPSAAKVALQYVYPPVQAQFARRLDAVVTATEPIAKNFRRQQYPNVKTIRNFPITERMEIGPLPIEREHEYVLVYVGGLVESRGLTKMLETVTILRRMDIDAALWLIGPFGNDPETTEQDVNAFLRRNDLTDHVRLLGYVPHEDIFDYLHGADIGLALVNMESFENALPTKIFEYMYTELPVIATDTGPARKYITEDYGRLVGEATDEIASTIADMIATENLDSMGERGRQQVLSQYNWEAEAKRLEALYAKLIE